MISCLTTTTTTLSLSLSLPDPSHSMYHCNTIYINISSHHPTTATLVATLRSTRPLNPDDDPDDDTASYAYMRCNAMQQCILQDMLHLMVQLTHVSHTHTKFLRNLILRLFHVSPFPCLSVCQFLSLGEFKKKRESSPASRRHCDDS